MTVRGAPGFRLTRFARVRNDNRGGGAHGQGAPHPEPVEGCGRGREIVSTASCFDRLSMRPVGGVMVSCWWVSRVAWGRACGAGLVCTLTSLTAVTHPEPCGDAAHQLCDHAQQRRQRELTKRWACKAMCVRSRRCHGEENTSGGGTRGKLGVQIFCVSHKSRGQSLEIVGEDFSVSDSARSCRYWRVRPRRLAMVRSTMRLGRVLLIQLPKGSGVAM